MSELAIVVSLLSLSILIALFRLSMAEKNIDFLTEEIVRLERLIIVVKKRMNGGN